MLTIYLASIVAATAIAAPLARRRLRYERRRAIVIAALEQLGRDFRAAQQQIARAFAPVLAEVGRQVAAVGTRFQQWLNVNQLVVCARHPGGPGIHARGWHGCPTGVPVRERR